MKKILLIQYFFSPNTSNQSFRYEQMIATLNPKDYQVDVLTSHHHGLEDVTKYSHGNIYRTNNLLLMKDFNQAIDTGNSEPTRRKVSRFRSSVKSLRDSLFWPDFSMLWVPKAIKLGKK